MSSDTVVAGGGAGAGAWDSIESLELESDAEERLELESDAEERLEVERAAEDEGSWSHQLIVELGCDRNVKGNVNTNYIKKNEQKFLNSDAKDSSISANTWLQSLLPRRNHWLWITFLYRARFSSLKWIHHAKI